MLLSGKRWQWMLPLLFFSNVLLSQEVAPYSRFGLGEPVSPVFAASKGMGRLGAGYRDPLNINFLNPASYSNLAFTTLENGFVFTTKKIKDGQTQQSYRTGDGFLDYLALGFPASTRAGVSFGIIPYSKMNYSITKTMEDDTLNVVQAFLGNGRTYQLYAGAGLRFPKNDTSASTFSLGLNCAYVFGNLERNNTLSFSRAGYYNTRILSDTRLNNFALNAGVQYRKKISDTLRVVIGAYGLFPVVSRSSEELLWSRAVVVSSGVLTVDTAYGTHHDNEDIRIPVEAGAGASIGNITKWTAGIEFKYTLWDKVEEFSEDATLTNSFELRAGGEFRPKPGSQNLFKNSSYRLGALYNNGYLQIGEQRIREYGVTFGIAVPIKTLFSRLNFSFETGSRGTTSNGLIRETFFRAYMGLTFNDKWFIKPKYD